MQKSPLKLIRCAILLLGVGSLQSCSSTLQIPVTHSIPMLGNQGDIECSINTAVSGLNFDAATALTNHYFVGCNFNFASISMYELNGGYYSKISKNGRFELQGGFDYGNQSGGSSYDPNEGYPYWTCTFHTNFASVFAQPALASVGKVGEIGISARLEYMGFPGFYFESVENNPGFPPSSTEVTNSWNNQLFLEPVFYCALGFRGLKLKFQAGVSIPIGGYGNSIGVFQAYNYGNVSIGLQIRTF